MIGASRVDLYEAEKPTLIMLITMNADDWRTSTSITKNDFKVRCMQVNEKLLKQNEIIPSLTGRREHANSYGSSEQQFEITENKFKREEAPVKNFDKFAHQFEDQNQQNAGKKPTAIDKFDDAFQVEKNQNNNSKEENLHGQGKVDLDTTNPIFQKMRGETHDLHPIMMSMQDGIMISKGKADSIYDYFRDYGKKNFFFTD